LFEKRFIEKIIYIHLQSARNSGLFYAENAVWKRKIADVAQLARAADL
jgi:hypothetical protein